MGRGGVLVEVGAEIRDGAGVGCRALCSAYASSWPGLPRSGLRFFYFLSRNWMPSGPVLIAAR